MRIHKLNPTLLPAAACLFLDVDGTLVEFEPTPDAVEVDNALQYLLQCAAAACDGAVALVSGRSIAQLDALFAPRQWPAAGLHGLERRDAAGRCHVHAYSREVPEPIRRALGELAARHPGVLLEHKGPALAVHYRLAAGLERLLQRELDDLLDRHGDGALRIQPGAYVLDITPAGVTKARAIEAFLDEPPFAGRTPIFAGDDLTDACGFAAVEQHGGISIAVGPRVSAMLNVDSPGALREVLREFLARVAAA